MIWCGAPFEHTQKVKNFNFSQFLKKLGCLETFMKISALYDIPILKKALIKTQGLYAKMTNFAHFTMFSNIADFDTNVTFSYHVLKHFLLRFSFKCFKIKVLVLDKLCYSNSDVKKTPPPIEILTLGILMIHVRISTLNFRCFKYVHLDSFKVSWRHNRSLCTYGLIFISFISSVLLCFMEVNFPDINFLLLHTFYERKRAKKPPKLPFSDQISVFEGRTTPNKRPIETCTKNVVLKAWYLSFPVR